MTQQLLQFIVDSSWVVLFPSPDASLPIKIQQIFAFSEVLNVIIETSVCLLKQNANSYPTLANDRTDTISKIWEKNLDQCSVTIFE